MNIVKYRKIFYIISFVLIGVSFYSIFTFGLKTGTDFSGGSLLEIGFKEDAPSKEIVNQVIINSGISNTVIQQIKEGGFSIKLREISQEEKNNILIGIQSLGFIPIEKSFTNVGPVLGKEALNKSIVSIILVLTAIVCFVAFAFRKVSKPISSWVYGFVAIIALLHDVIIPTGIFAIFGNLYGFEIDTLFITAILVILGFSVHDTIVVFDRVRENLNNSTSPKTAEEFDKIVDESVRETFIRSLNTSLTTLLAIAVLYIWGPDSIKHFSLTLLIGITVGTYSSIFIGSPLLTTINRFKFKK